MTVGLADDGKNWSVADHSSAEGISFSDRYSGLTADVEYASSHELWQYFRYHKGRVSVHSDVLDEAGRLHSGLNFGSQDYLGLANDKRVAEAALAAIQTYGVHSSGSAPMGGGSQIGNQLADRISSILEVENTLLFPTGWAAGYGAIKALVRPHDFIVMDALSHNCLQHGAYASTGNVSVFSHNSVNSLERRLIRIRRNNPKAAILIVTESLFSMDSDAPRLNEFIEMKKKYSAHILLDIAHDFGVLGPNGRGLGYESQYSEMDIIVGSFSKTFASIGGFVSTNNRNLIRAIQGYSGSYTFSNYLIPPQIGAVDEAMKIAFSEEGDSLRKSILQKCGVLRKRLAEKGIKTLGIDSAMIIVGTGDEVAARRAYRNLLRRGIILNCIEYPAVRKGDTRFRVQLTPRHTEADLTALSNALGDVLRQPMI